jgi:DNA-3-methyladenine glycosylase I
MGKEAVRARGRPRVSANGTSTSSKVKNITNAETSKGAASRTSAAAPETSPPPATSASPSSASSSSSSKTEPRVYEDGLPRCGWLPAKPDPLYTQYHDDEWGVPVVGDDQRLFELLTLEGAQAGLSWQTVLHKREGYRRVFHGFDLARVAAMRDAEITAALADPGIVRNRLKVHATVANAKAILEMQRAGGSFSDYVWSHAPGGEAIVNTFRSLSEYPSATPLSKSMSVDLKKRGFRFVGPTIMYAFLQACGVVIDHSARCFRAGRITTTAAAAGVGKAKK